MPTTAQPSSFMSPKSWPNTSPHLHGDRGAIQTGNTLEVRWNYLANVLFRGVEMKISQFHVKTSLNSGLGNFFFRC